MEPQRIAVVGDPIIDHTVFVEPAKIAQEAPIIAHRILREEFTQGGAGAVKDMIDALGHKSTMSIYEMGLNVPVSRKIRYVSAGSRNPTIVGRFDVDVTYVITPELIRRLVDHVRGFKPDVIVVSDYNKGIVTEDLVWALRSVRATMIVDPYTPDWSKYAGADIILPSRAAAAEFLEDEDLRGFHAVVSKLDSEGCRLYGCGPAESFETTSRAVIDVTGAGDQFLATLACHLRPGIPLRQAVWMANLAAGMQVERMGIEAVTADELRLRAAQVSELELAAAG